LPLYLQNAFGWSAIAAGLGMLPFAIAMIVGPHIGSALATRVSSHAVLTLGLLLIGVGNWVTAFVARDAQYGWVGFGMLVTGIGAGLLNGDTQKAIMACVPTHRTGMASGISTTTRFTAIVTSVGVLGAVLAARTRMGLASSMAAMPIAGGKLDADFLSSVLAGDVTQATSHLPPAARMLIAAASRASFASGFASALCVAGLLAVVIAAGVWILSGRRDDDSQTPRAE
jgi:hypothetical protein